VIKIRLRGLKSDIDDTVAALIKCDDLRVHDVSLAYKDKGESEYFRVYVEAEAKPQKKPTRQKSVSP
jgi:hypothetical protein